MVNSSRISTNLENKISSELMTHNLDPNIKRSLLSLAKPIAEIIADVVNEEIANIKA